MYCFINIITLLHNKRTVLWCFLFFFQPPNSPEDPEYLGFFWRWQEQSEILHSHGQRRVQVLDSPAFRYTQRTLFVQMSLWALSLSPRSQAQCLRNFPSFRLSFFFFSPDRPSLLWPTPTWEAREPESFAGPALHAVLFHAAVIWSLFAVLFPILSSVDLWYFMASFFLFICISLFFALFRIL